MRHTYRRSMVRLMPGLAALALASATAPAMAAQLTVSPSEAASDTVQTFAVSVPNTTESIAVSIKLSLPAGLSEVVPLVKPGWAATLKKDGDKVTDITWTGGGIPVGYQDEFRFSAKAKGGSSLTWNVVEGFQNGSTVSWDKADGNARNAVTTVGSSGIAAVGGAGAVAAIVAALVAALAALALAGYALVSVRRRA